MKSIFVAIFVVFGFFLLATFLVVEFPVVQDLTKCYASAQKILDNVATIGKREDWDDDKICTQQSTALGSLAYCRQDSEKRLGFIPFMAAASEAISQYIAKTAINYEAEKLQHNQYCAYNSRYFIQ